MIERRKRKRPARSQKLFQREEKSMEYDPDEQEYRMDFADPGGR